ncbi:MAG TPA: hypothetical protein PLE74_03380 [Candidatus Cloacimonadota bacterium]|nr:hypothetical protein [Candidatus Cloacimonadota bacterium]HPT71303.1 hypothetical protein [Candidatus Cloacimonadota bacterium]
MIEIIPTTAKAIATDIMWSRTPILLKNHIISNMTIKIRSRHHRTTIEGRLKLSSIMA